MSPPDRDRAARARSSAAQTAQAAQITSLQSGQAALFDLADLNRHDIRRANEGVAMALAMETPQLPEGAHFAVAGGVGYFRQRTSATFALAARIAPGRQQRRRRREGRLPARMVTRRRRVTATVSP